MGKRFVAGYGLYANPRFASSAGGVGINLTHEGYVEYAIKRSISIGFSAKLYRAVYTNERDIVLVVGNAVNQIDRKPAGFYDIKGRNYAVYFKFYRRNYLAPWGKYMILGAGLNTIKTIYDPETMYVTGTDMYSGKSYVYYSDFGPNPQTFKRFDILFGNGRNRMIGKRVTLDYGYVMNVIGMASILVDAAELSNKSTSYMSAYIKETAVDRARARNKFNVFLKVGVLLF